jgi:hypothetical protein
MTWWWCSTAFLLGAEGENGVNGGSSASGQVAGKESNGEKQNTRGYDCGQVVWGKSEEHAGDKPSRGKAGGNHTSRYLLLCEAMESIKEQGAFTAFERLFKERGLPRAIRSDNGVPFASPNGLFNLSRFAVRLARSTSSIRSR